MIVVFSFAMKIQQPCDSGANTFPLDFWRSSEIFSRDFSSITFKMAIFEESVELGPQIQMANLAGTRSSLYGMGFRAPCPSNCSIYSGQSMVRKVLQS